MTKIFDEFQLLISARPNYAARGFTNVDCPACNDKRKRGGFAPTPTGGFRYTCFNGGCTFSDHATGWEPGNGLSGRVRQLFEMLGGDVQRIPLADRMRQNRAIYDDKGNVIGQEEKLEIANKFPEVDLPRGSEFLDEIAQTDPRAALVLEYLNRRSPLFMSMETSAYFMWSPAYPEHLILPFLHFNDKIVGYIGRHVGEDGSKRFIQRAPPDFMFNQYLMSELTGKYVFVTESPMDAILLRGVATRSNRISQKQINLLKISGRQPVLIPDQNSSEAGPYLEAAKNNDWLISIPDWKGKDVGDSVTRNGLLSTIELITSSMTTNYMKAKKQLGIKTP